MVATAIISSLVLGTLCLAIIIAYGVFKLYRRRQIQRLRNKNKPLPNHPDIELGNIPAVHTPQGSRGPSARSTPAENPFSLEREISRPSPTQSLLKRVLAGSPKPPPKVNINNPYSIDRTGRVDTRSTMATSRGGSRPVSWETTGVDDLVSVGREERARAGGANEDEDAWTDVISGERSGLTSFSFGLASEKTGRS